MKNQLLHTPDGVRDIYNGECKKKLVLQEKLHKVLLSYGYQDIQTPTFEFFNIFSAQIGTTPSKDLYKFFDKEGNTLVLRPDFTPSIARSAVKYYMDEKQPVKLSYMGNTFVNNSNYQGRLKETTQCGAELIGDASIQGDAEILAMVVDSLKTSGLKDFQISVGHANFFRGLIQAANLDEEVEEELSELLRNKNFFGVEEILKSYHLAPELMDLFSLLGNFDASVEVLTEAKAKAKNYPTISAAIEDLIALAAMTALYDIDRYISFELGIISEHSYYTGIIFSGYTFGTGEAIVKGGRYDQLIRQFGKDAPAIGFAIVVDQLMNALTRQKIELAVEEDAKVILYKADEMKEAVAKAKELRAAGQNVNLILEDTIK